MAAPSDQPLVCPILVGRTSSLELLFHSIDKVRREKGQTVLIAGEAGVGKSRLVAEVVAQAAARDSQLLHGHCFEQDRALSYAPVLDLLHTFVTEHSPDELLSSLGPAAPELAQLFPELVTLLPDASTALRPSAEFTLTKEGLSTDSDKGRTPNRGSGQVLPPTPTLEPEQVKRRLFQSFFQFFTQSTTSRSLILVVEDLHWSDDPSLEFLLYLARRIASLPILLLFTYRNDEMQPSLLQFLATLDRERLATEITLARLNRTEAGEMLRAILGLQHPVRAELLDALYDLTEGNPFFIEEILKSLIAAGEIIHSGDAWVSEPLARLHIPRSVHAAIQRRVTPLSDAARQMLGLAAVAGRRFDFALLQRLTHHDEQELLHLAKELIAAQLVVEESAERFAFRHALTRQAIYSGLLVRERQVLHRDVAEITECIYQDSLDPSPGGGHIRLTQGMVYADEGRVQSGSGQAAHLADLAYHYYEAGVWEKALHYSQRAGENAQTLYAPRAVVEHFTHALEAARQLGQAPSPELLRARASAYETLGQFDNARADFETALQLVRALTPRDPQMELTLLLDLGLLWQGRDFSQTGKYYELALEQARAMNNPSTLAHTLNRVGNWYVNIEKPLEGLQYHRGARDIFEKLRDRSGLAKTLDLMGLASNFSGDLIQGSTYYKQAIALFRELDDREGLASSLAIATMCGGNYGTATMVPAANPTEADREGEEALKIAQEMGWRSGEAVALMMWGRCLGPQGDYARAFATLKKALELAKQIEHRQWITATEWTLGQFYLDVLALTEARQHLEQGLALAKELNSMHLLHCNTGSLASACIVENDLTRAEFVLEQVLHHDTPMQTQGQRLCWGAQAELTFARGEPQLALEIVERLIASAPNVVANENRIIPYLWQLRGEMLTRMKRCDEAEHVLQAAQEAAFRQGARPLLWRIHISLGKVYQMRGRREEAEDEFSAARTILEELSANVPDPSLRDNFMRRACALIPRVPPLSPRRAAKRKFEGLTERECEIAALIAQGKSNRETANALVISQRTAEVHVGNIMSKLGFTSRAQIAVWATEKGLAKGSSK